MAIINDHRQQLLPHFLPPPGTSRNPSRNTVPISQHKIPPFEVNIFLRFRFSRHCRPCTFSRARTANYQLDIELIRPVGHESDIQEVEDLQYNPVGCRCGTTIAADGLFTRCLVMVKGRLYTDDEPYWECLLEEGKTYDVAYCN